MEGPRSISRRDLLRSGVAAAGATVSACSHYSPAEYTINSLAGADRHQVMKTEFEGVTPIQIIFRPDATVHPYDAPVWRVNSAALSYPVFLSSSHGQMKILVDREYKDPGENKKWRGFLFTRGSEEQEQAGYEFEIGNLTVGRADKVILNKEKVPPEDRDNVAVEVRFADASGRGSVNKTLRETGGTLALMQYDQNFQAVKDSRLLFYLQSTKAGSAKK